MNKAVIPTFVRPFLWSYDINQMDLETDKVRIITNVLNLGDEQSVSWLIKTYRLSQIKEVVSKPRPGEWDKKSLNFWGLIFDLSIDYPPPRRV